ncbi:hypothetical protein K438DRAFT_2165669 [Mycena galopus ATCC 62051]|nr:hypothetical protein K438DRAFT_2165669 [Mycena galopus ATCC 62051]
MPLFILTYWQRVKNLRLSRLKWAQAKEHLTTRSKVSRKHGSHPDVVRSICDALQSIYWSGVIEGFEHREPILGLSIFASREWFTDSQQSYMLDLLRSDVLNAGRSLKDEIGEIWVMEFIRAAWRDRGAYIELEAKPKPGDNHSRARALGAVLGSGDRERFGIIGNLQNLHWIAVVVDGKNDRILYGDPLQPGSSPINPDAETIDALEWWTSFHTGRRFVVGGLAVPRQQDGHNCGILSHNALAHHFLPEQYPLIDVKGKGPADARLEMMMRIINRHIDVSPFISILLATYKPVCIIRLVINAKSRPHCSHQNQNRHRLIFRLHLVSHPNSPPPSKLFRRRTRSTTTSGKTPGALVLHPSILH